MYLFAELILEKRTPSDQDLHVILDNVSTHKTEAVRKWLASHSRIHFHFTPTRSSWLNAVEGWFAQLERKALYRGVFNSVKELKEAIHEFIDIHNEKLAKPFKWTKSAEKIIQAVERARKVLPN